MKKLAFTGLLLLVAFFVGGAIMLHRSTATAMAAPVPMDSPDGTVAGPTTGEAELTLPIVGLPSRTGSASTSTAGRTPAIPVKPGPRPPAPAEEWRILFQPIPHQARPLCVRLESKRGHSVESVSSPVAESNHHVTVLKVSPEALLGATLLVATSPKTLRARDGRLFPLTKVESGLGLGSTTLASGTKDRDRRTVTDLTVPLTAPASIGHVLVAGTQNDPVQLLVWTAEEEGFPMHTLIGDAPLGQPLAVGSFGRPSTWFADVLDVGDGPKSTRSATGLAGTDLTLILQ